MMEKVIKNFVPQGGKHCITNSLKQVFSYYGYPMTEEMIFGLASGLSFLYINQSDSPMVNGRIKVFEFEEKLAQRLNITIKCKAGKVYSRIFDTTKQMIDTNHPVLVYVDMPYLSYLGMDPNSHFGGHAIVLFGYDDTTNKFLISDRDNHDYPIQSPQGTLARDCHFVDYEEMEAARSSKHRPFPANNKYLTFDFAGYRPPDKKILCNAIRETCDHMLNPPAQLLGINGIRKCSKEISKWKQFSPAKLRLAGITNYFQINKAGGTGGGIFRSMYGEFLKQSASILQDKKIFSLGEEFIEVSKLWDQLADDMWQLSLHVQPALLEKMSSSIRSIYEQEKALYTALDDTVGN